MDARLKSPKLVGNFIRERRESLGLSQRALGLLFDPPVTTQFISNIERGVTPLPPVHVPTLTKALLVPEAEFTALLEREYALKLTGRLGKTLDGSPGAGDSGFALDGPPQVMVAANDREFIQSLYD